MIRGVMHPGAGSSGDQKKENEAFGVRLGHVGLVKQEHKEHKRRKFWFSWDEGEPGWALRLKSLAGGVQWQKRCTSPGNRERKVRDTRAFECQDLPTLYTVTLPGGSHGKLRTSPDH
jgi:hypothetical protein